MKHPVLGEFEERARKAGAIVRDGYDQPHTVSYKGIIDPVTEVDHASEKFILSEIARRWPDSTIRSEESGLTPGGTEHAWYVDPLDGTVNYAHKVPIFCVSIAYAHEGAVELGAVYDPMRDEMFHAAAGRGASLNGAPIRVSGVAELGKSLLATGFPYDLRTSPVNNLGNWGRFLFRRDVPSSAPRILHS